jgi:hypothetical protein
VISRYVQERRRSVRQANGVVSLQYTKSDSRLDGAWSVQRGSITWWGWHPEWHPHGEQDSHRTWWCKIPVENNMQNISCWMDRWDYWWHTHRQAKTKDHDKECQRKKQKWLLTSYDETPSPEGSPKYQESNLSSSTTESNDGGNGGDQCRIEPSGRGTQFASDKYNLNMLHMQTFFFFEMWLMLHPSF